MYVLFEICKKTPFQKCMGWPTRMQKDFFLQPLALLITGHGLCERRKITVSTNNGLRCIGLVHNIDIVTTHNDHPSYVKHVLGIICVFFYPIWVLGVCLGGVSPKGLVQSDGALAALQRFGNPPLDVGRVGPPEVFADVQLPLQALRVLPLVPINHAPHRRLIGGARRRLEQRDGAGDALKPHALRGHDRGAGQGRRARRRVIAHCGRGTQRIALGGGPCGGGLRETLRGRRARLCPRWCGAGASAAQASLGASSSRSRKSGAPLPS